MKHRLGRLRLPVPTHVYVVSRRKWLGIEPLAFDEACAAHDARLPPYHSDPFDRGLVAQAIVHGLTVVTPDPRFRRILRSLFGEASGPDEPLADVYVEIDAGAKQRTPGCCSPGGEPEAKPWRKGPSVLKFLKNL